MVKRKQRRRKAGRRPEGKRGSAGRAETRQMLGAAVRLLQAGQIPRARTLIDQVLEIEPRNADALQFSGLCWFQSGHAARARELIERAISENPRVAPYHDNLGKVLEHQGDFDQALVAYSRANELEPGVADRQFNMGVVLQRMGRLQDAERRFLSAISEAPDDADYHFNLGYVLKSQGRHGDAVAAYRKALALDPGSAKIKNNLGNVLLLEGDVSGAVELLREAAAGSPGNAHYQNNLGNALRELGEMDQAVTSYRRAIEVDPTLADAYRNLGNALVLAGRMEEAARAFLRAWRRFPDLPELRRGFVAAARQVTWSAHDPSVEVALHACMEADDVDPRDLSRAAAAQLRARLGIEAGQVAEPETLALALAGDGYALRLLETVINADPVLEDALTRVRSWLLGFAAGGFSQPLFSLACALARQCFINEYVFAEGGAETGEVGARVSDLRAALSKGPIDEPKLTGLIAGVALYRPLHRLDVAEPLAEAARDAAWPEPLRAVVARALLAPLEEARIEKRIRCLKEVSNPTSVAVKAQYETNPYPRWLRLPKRERQTYRAYLNRLFPGFEAPASLDQPVRALVAGCGTGYEAIAAAANRVCARVLGVDLSRASLAYAVRMAAETGVDNVEFLQADVLDMPATGETFEVVESSGVLHHLADPEAGWKALYDCLVPGGFMKVGLYSERARRAVVAARDRVREMNLGADSEGIRRIRSRIFNAPEDDPLRELRESEDLYTTSACRDLLFHVCEHRFTLGRIQSGLDELGLEFIGFELPFSFMHSRFRTVNPGNESLSDLNAWARVEDRYPDTFAAMYVFWCRKRR